jgi:type IV pilus assembly protein PilN
MIKINLLPFRAARKRENVKRQITIYALCVFFTLTAMAYFFVKLSDNLSNLKDIESEREKELQSYQKELAEIKDLEKKIKQIKTKLAVIDRLQEGKTGPVLLLSDIAEAVPKDRLYLTSLSEKKGSLSLTGTAMDNETVALFMENLEATKQITAPPDLKKLSKKEIKAFNLQVSDFSIDCKTYSAPAKKKKKKKKKKK